MKRLVVTGPRQVEFEDVPIPDCPRDGVLAKAVVTTISTGTETRVYRRTPVDDEGTMQYPGIPFPDGPTENGYSMVGEVVEVGADVEGFSVGERVFLGEAHKEYAAVRASGVVKLPDSIPTDQAVMLNLLGVGHIALRTGDPAPGENVAVVGLGVIGQSAVAWCRAFGFRTAGIDMDGGRLDVARAMGANATASPADADFQSRIDDVFAGEGADLVIEAASTWRAIRTSMDIVRRGWKGGRHRHSRRQAGLQPCGPPLPVAANHAEDGVRLRRPGPAVGPRPLCEADPGHAEQGTACDRADDHTPRAVA